MTGKIERSITHWTGGPGRATTLDRKHYHRITEHDGTVVQGNEKIEDNITTADGDYAAHTLNLNSGSAGFAMAGMLDATEIPFRAGPAPINEVQFEAHCQMLAEFHLSKGIPITHRTCLTHAEVEGTLGVRQNGKWDLTRLPFKPELRGARPVGDYMRDRVRFYAHGNPTRFVDRPVIREGDVGTFVRSAQDRLSALGYPLGRADGIFGRLTKAAVVSFQAQNGLVADGIIGPLTWEKLRVALPRKPRHVDIGGLRAAGSRTVKAADTGQMVSGVLMAGSLAQIAVDVLGGALQEITSLEGFDDLVLLLAAEIGVPGGVALAALAAFRQFQKTKNARLDDARNLKNLSR